MTPETKPRNDNFKIEILPDKTPAFTPRSHLKHSGVDEVILETQKTALDWANREAVDRLHDISSKLIRELAITVKVGKQMKVPTFHVKSKNRKSFGEYHPERDGYAIPETVSVNEKWLGKKTDEQGRMVPVLTNGALALHLLVPLLCAWRHQTGGSGNFDGTVKAKLRSFGIILNKKDKIERVDPDGKFAKALSNGGIGKPPDIAAVGVGGEGESTNRLYSCNCQRARVGRGKFVATCPLCSRPFEPGDHVGKHPANPKVPEPPYVVRQV